MNKTDSPELVGKHKFEVAGLGRAPFRFVGMSVNMITYPDGGSKPGGTCDYCGTGIMNEFAILSACGKRSVVGCDCIAKVGDHGILKAYRSTPAYRAAQRAKAQAKATADYAKLEALLTAPENVAKLSAMPHSYGFIDRTTGKPLTYLDQVKWAVGHCGAAGRKNWLKTLSAKLDLTN